jgi:two-component system sensor kinase FixL
VLLNLIRNAIESMVATPRQRRIAISARNTGAGTIEVAVADNGPGLSDAVKERLFQPFNTSKERGMGVGLSICRTIDEAHGGTIVASDTEGGGATFTFSLPIDRQRPPGSPG